MRAILQIKHRHESIIVPAFRTVVVDCEYPQCPVTEDPVKINEWFNQVDSISRIAKILNPDEFVCTYTFEDCCAKGVFETLLNKIEARKIHVHVNVKYGWATIKGKNKNLVY